MAKREIHYGKMAYEVCGNCIQFQRNLFDDDLSFCLKWKTNVKALGYCTNFKVRPELTDALQDKSQAGVLVQGQDI